MKIRFNCVGYTDRRGPRELAAARALEQSRADKALQERFDEGVRQREERQLRSRRFDQPSALEHALTAPAVLCRQAD